MSKYLKVFFLAMLVVTLIATTAFAGRARVNQGSVNDAAVNVAWEAMNTTRAINISSAAANILANSAANSASVTYSLTQQLLAATQYILKVDLSGATFNGAAGVNVCAMNGAAQNNTIAQVGSAVPGAVSSYNFNINTANAFAPGSFLILTNTGCTNEAATNVAVNLSAASSTGSATITMELLQGGTSIDSASTATLANIINEYIPTINSSNHTIDYLGTPGNGTRVINNAGVANLTADGRAAGVANHFDITRRAPDFTTTGTYALNTNNSSVSLTDSAAWQGISKVYVMRGGEASCASANAHSSAISTSPSGTVTLRIGAAGNFGGAAAANWYVCAEANGTEPIQTRTIRGSITVATSGQSQAATAYSNVMVFNTNAYQGVLPWAVSASSVKTYCLINNTGNAAANVVFDLLSKESASATLSNLAVTQVGAGVSKLIIFDEGKITDDAGTTLATLTGISTNNRYAGRITVTTGGNQANVACVQNDPVTGAKRAVPVLTNGNNTIWQQ